MNVTSLITVVYENKSNWTLGQNKPNSNPIKPNQTQFPQRKNETKFQNKFRWITRKGPDIKKDLDLSPGPNSGGIICISEDTFM